MQHCKQCDESTATQDVVVCLECYEALIAKSQFWSAANPLFVLLRVCVVMGFLTFILYVNAQTFDKNELRIMAGMFVVVALGEGAWAAVRKFIGK